MRVQASGELIEQQREASFRLQHQQRARGSICPEQTLEDLTSLSAPNSSFVTVLRISDLCKSVHGGSSANVMYLNSCVSLLSGGEASSWSLSQLSKAPPSTAGSSNEPDPGNAVLAAGPHTAAVSATSAAGCAVSSGDHLLGHLAGPIRRLATHNGTRENAEAFDRDAKRQARVPT